MNITIQDNIKDVVKQIQYTQQKQLPFAMALALTRTAKQAQQQVIQELPDHFHIRNDYIKRGVSVTNASKNDRNPFAIVGSRTPFMNLQQEGGTKTPKERKFVPIAVDVRRSIEQKIPFGKLPQNLKNRKDVFAANIHGTYGVWQRVKRTRKNAGGPPLMLLYDLKPSAHVKPRWGFDVTVNKVANERIKSNFVKALKDACESSR